jgi:kinesin family protein 6/9
VKNIIDEEEFELIKQKKMAKRDYKMDVEKIKELRNAIVQMDANITQLKTAMIQSFEQWFFKRYGISVADLDNPLLNEQENDHAHEEVLN